MNRRIPSLPRNTYDDADGAPADRHWVKIYPQRLNELLTTTAPSRSALRLLLHLMTRLDNKSATVHNWSTLAGAHTLHQHPDTTSAATTELITAGVLRKTPYLGTTQLHLDPTLTFRGRRTDHLAVLQGNRIPAPRERWIKAFTHGLRELHHPDLTDAHLRVALRLYALIDTGNTTLPLGPTKAEAGALKISTSGMAGALKDLDESHYIARHNGRNSGPITINPLLAHLGGGRQRHDELTSWRTRSHR